ncbi:MAG: hypothetical protein ASARMPREDX12_002210 [Alectoria sarmentosa]|nr:MAG: hypothetical protein ASARMPREDX12_002210 [Alectoria sarmentosa]CAD6577315.1 MAG: hypothetical protein ASARMPRED_008212 [Alectoria sarmentosa]
MASGHLSIDDFLTRLTSLFESRRVAAHGSVFLTQKRLSPPDLPSGATDIPLPPSSPFPDLHPPHPLPVLIRATNGKSKEKKKDKIKISTVVQADELDRFFVKYAEVWKAGMSGLKKRDRSGRKKGKAKKKGAGPGDGQKVKEETKVKQEKKG